MRNHYQSVRMGGEILLTGDNIYQCVSPLIIIDLPFNKNLTSPKYQKRYFSLFLHWI